MTREIGGYIELETGNTGEYYLNAIKINSARNGIRYAIKAYNIKQLYVPSYTCPVVWQAIEQENCKVLFYNIDENFLPLINFKEDDFVLYTNYFGICSENIKNLSVKYKNLIVDNAQGFYMKPYGIASTYSPRKFFGVSDGGYLVIDKKINIKIDKDTSYQRFSHLLKRADCGSNFGYDDFNRNDDSLINEDIKEMSELTKKILSGIDYNEVREKRLANYKFLEKELSSINNLKINLTDDVPMYYPFLLKNDNLRKILIANKIFIPQCWRNFETKNTSQWELYLNKYLFPLIIDQRYNSKDMEYIVKVIKESL